MSKAKIVQNQEDSSDEVCAVSREELFDLKEMFQDQLEKVNETLKQILSRMTALEQQPTQSRNAKARSGSKSGGDKVYEVPDFSTDSRNLHNEDRQDYRMKIDLQNFSGNLKIEDFLDWLAEVERFFDYTKIPEEKQAKLVAYKFKGSASA